MTDKPPFCLAILLLRTNAVIYVYLYGVGLCEMASMSIADEQEWPGSLKQLVMSKSLRYYIKGGVVPLH